MVHYLVYADRFDTNGLISSPPGAGRKDYILEAVGTYEKDFPALSAHAPQFPTPDTPRALAKQGAVDPSPPEGYSSATEGSD